MHINKHEQDSFSKVSLWLMEQISCVVPITVLTKMLAVVYALKFLYCYLKGTNFKVLNDTLSYYSKFLLKFDHEFDHK